MPNRYFFGPSVRNNEVRASAARTFRQLVSHHLEAAIRLAHTRAEYEALKTKKERLAAKDTTYLLACTYRQGESERSLPNAEDCCNLLFLDLDEEEGRCPAAPFVRNPVILKGKLDPFNFAAYTTASSTPAKPRMRIVIEADGIPLARYPAAVKTVARMLGLGGQFDPRSLVPNQPMICPTLFKDQAEDLEHPLLITELKGRAFTVEDIVETEGEQDRKVAGPMEEPDGDEDGLEYLRAPVMGLTLEKVKDALDALNPDMPYPEWFDVAAALRHQFSHTQPDEAYELFDTWSAKGSKYTGADDTLAKWNSVKPTPRGRVPLTIRTLIKRASDAGWSTGEAKEECFDAVMDWIAHHAQTRHDLTHVALEKVAGLPMLTSVEEEMLLSAIRQHLKDTRKESITVTTLRKDLKRIQSAKERAKEEVSPAPEHPCWKGWCYVTATEEFFRPSSHQKMSAEALNSALGRFLLPSEEQLEKAGKEVNEATLNTPYCRPSDYLLNHKQCLVVDDYSYDPSNPKEIYTEDANGVRTVNTYRKSYAKPSRDSKAVREAGDIIQGHFRNLVAEEEYRATLIDYIAYMVQFPGKKIRWCPLIQGAEGCGKTVIARLLEAILGLDNVGFVNNDGIRSQWNDWALGKQVVVVSEVYVSGAARKDTMNRLKDLVTDDRVPINQRQRTSRTEGNCANFIMFTNHHDALLLMFGSRRYFILKSLLQTEEQVNALGDGYFDHLFNAIYTKAAELRAFFEQWEVSDDFQPDGRAPKTRYLEEMIEDGMDEDAAVFSRMVKEKEDPLVASDIVASGRLRTLFDMKGVRATSQSIGAMLRSLNYTKAGDFLVAGEREHLWYRSGVLPRGADVASIARQRAEPEDWI